MENNMFILNMDRKRFTPSQRIMKFLLDNKCRIMDERDKAKAEVTTLKGILRDYPKGRDDGSWIARREEALR
jgi:hypothetical protein